jgi:hypothetical protein
MSDRMSSLVIGALGFRAGGTLRLIVALLVLVFLGGLGLDLRKAWELADERQALEARAFELVTRAMAPGSPLACLDVVAGSTFQEGCEKALFATPEGTAAAVAYVAAQLSLLAAGKDYQQRAGGGRYGDSLAQLRRNAEWDAFGIVAHVLAARDGCTASECRALAMLSSPQRVRANLARRAFDANVSRYAAVWANGGRSEVVHLSRPVEAPEALAASTPAPPPRRLPSKYFLPSADSIPAVSIMAPEPVEAPTEKAKPATAEAAHKPPARTSAGVTANAAATSAPMPLTPPGR